MSFSTFSGNYWDRYEGYDLDRDGVGDVPHRPVTLFSVVAEQHESALYLYRSVLVDLLDTAERLIPVLTPTDLSDTAPKMTTNLYDTADMKHMLHMLHVLTC